MVERTIPILALVCVAAAGTAWVAGSQGTAPRVAKGYVFEDTNNNGRRDPGERGISGVRVSDQTLITTTNREGYWQLPLEADQDTVYFITKPRGFRAPVNEDQLPRFFYSHKPAGSPKSNYPGVNPTGELPAYVNFPLVPSKEPNKFKALVFGDTQPRDLREVDYIRRDIVEPLIGNHENSQFGVTLGDIVFDDLRVMPAMNRTIALLDLPWFNVIGNHDINTDAKTDDLSDETFERFYGPNYYSFEWGPVHFVVMDNVKWQREGEKAGYTGEFGAKQLAWLKEDLRLTPKGRLTVFMMHIPLYGTADKQSFFDLIGDRPYAMSVSAHQHFQQHVFFTDKDGVKAGKEHHHLVNVTTSGSWWQGAPDELGIPHTTMRDGAPNGYSIFSFDGTQYSIEYRAARRQTTYQMEIHSPAEIEAGSVAGTPLLVNVFGGNAKSKVEFKIGQSGTWQLMTHTSIEDPAYAAMAEADKTLARPYRPLPAPMKSHHIWTAPMPRTGERGLIPVAVRTTDMFGQTSVSTKGMLIK